MSSQGAIRREGVNLYAMLAEQAAGQISLVHARKRLSGPTADDG
jgi:hypothetical protein